jgi:hypothetical protein
MNTSTIPKSSLQIRPLQYSDLNAIASLLQERLDIEYKSCQASLLRKIRKYQSYFGLLQLSHIFAGSFCQNLYLYIAEKDGQIHGFIEVSPVNHNRTTWKVEQVLVNHNTSLNHLLIGNCSIGSQLLRYCFEKIWEARTWILEVDINEKNTIGLYRENGFQPIEQITYWECDSTILNTLAEQETNLSNLLPVSNADSRLIYQLDCVCMPPMLRQIFDRHIEDFKRGIWQYFREKLQAWFNEIDTISAYVFEPQRKAAIGYFKLERYKNGSQSHQATLLVHPAYTWLYPKLLSKMAELVTPFPSQSLILSSSNYQAEREEYLENLGASRQEHNLLMSRSVWHKLRESKSLDLSLPEVLKGLKPVHNPIPTPWTKSYWQDNPHSSSRPHPVDEQQSSN